MFRVGSLTLKIPGGSFVEQVEHDGADERRDGERKDAFQLLINPRGHGRYAGEGEIEIGPRGKFAFRLRARGANLGLLVNPIDGGLSIGGDVWRVVSPR